MKASKYWTLKLLPVDGEKHWHIIDGNGNIVVEAPLLTDVIFLRMICDEHNKTHLSN